MPVLRSRLDPASPEARANLEAMTALVAELRSRGYRPAEHASAA